MGKLEIQDDCSEHDRFLRIDYSGPNPLSVVKRISSSIKPFFHVSSSGTAQTKYLIDNSGDPVKFFSTWWVKINVSAYTKLWIEIKVQGEESKRNQTGSFSFQIWGFVKTSFSGRNFFLKPFWLLYSYIFYDRQRRKYIEKCRNVMLNFRQSIKEHYNIGGTEIPSKGVYG